MEKIIIKETSAQLWGKEKRTKAAMIQKWGNHASSALLDPTFTLFDVPTIDGVIGYRLRMNCAVVFGDPVCPPQDMLQLVEAFSEFCTKQSYNIIYVIASEQFAGWALEHGYTYALEMGKEFILDPMIDPKVRPGIHGGALRNKWNYSLRRGLTAKEYTGHDSALEGEIEELAKRWLANRKGPQIHFYTAFNIFEGREHKRYFYAMHEGKVVGVLFLDRLDAYDGWILQMCLLAPDAPSTTSEFLVLSLLDVLRAEGCHYFSIGVNPSTTLDRLQGLGPITRWIARRINTLSNKIFKLEKRIQYWRKFHPQEKPVFVVMDKKGFLLRKAAAIMKAFNASVW